MTNSSTSSGAGIRCGFTFIEVICILLVVTFGLIGVIGLVSHGLIVAQKSQGTCTGMLTAVTVADDAKPLLPPDMQTSWNYVTYDLNSAGAVTNTIVGFINGYYVKRVETTGPSDIIATDKDTGVVQTRSVAVAVDVYDTLGGLLVASYSTRFIRQRGLP